MKKIKNKNRYYLSISALAIAFAFAIVCNWYSLNSGIMACLKATATPIEIFISYIKNP